MKALMEKHLWERIPGNCRLEGEPSTREVIESMVDQGLIDSAKQAWRTLEKWIGRGWYEYGCSLDLGWKLPEKYQVEQTCPSCEVRPTGGTFCPECRLELRQLEQESLTPEERLVREYRKLVRELIWQNSVAKFNLQHEPDTQKRLERIARHLVWQDAALEAAARLEN